MKTNPFHRFMSFDYSALSEYTFGEILDSFKTTRTYAMLEDESIMDDNIQTDSMLLVTQLLCRRPAMGAMPEIGLRTLHKALSFYPAHDPAPGLYASLGFTPVCLGLTHIDNNEDLFAVQITGQNAVVLNLQYRERILPGKIVQEKLVERVAEFEKKEGRPAHKKDWAILKDEVKAAMLKTALVRRTDIPVIIGKGLIHVFTSSAKRCEDVLAYLRSVFGTLPVRPLYQHPSVISDWMKQLTTAYDSKEDPEDLRFLPGHYIKFESQDDDGAVAVKNELARDKDGYTTHELLKRNYVPVEMDLTYSPDGLALDEEDDDLAPAPFHIKLRLNVKGAIKQFAFNNMDADTLDEQFGIDSAEYTAKLWLVFKEIDALFSDLLEQGVICGIEELTKLEADDKDRVDDSVLLASKAGSAISYDEFTDAVIGSIEQALGLYDIDTADALADEEEDDEL